MKWMQFYTLSIRICRPDSGLPDLAFAMGGLKKCKPQKASNDGSNDGPLANGRQRMGLWSFKGFLRSVVASCWCGNVTGCNQNHLYEGNYEDLKGPSKCFNGQWRRLKFTFKKPLSLTKRQTCILTWTDGHKLYTKITGILSDVKRLLDCRHYGRATRIYRFYPNIPIIQRTA